MGKLIGANDLISVCALLDELRAHSLREFVPEFGRLPLESRHAVIKATNGIRSIIEGMPAVEAVPARRGEWLKEADFFPRMEMQPLRAGRVESVAVLPSVRRPTSGCGRRGLPRAAWHHEV